MIFRKSPEMQIETFSESFGNSMDRNVDVRILLKDGIFRNVNGELLGCFSPFVNSILKGLPCCISPTIFLPDVSAECVDHVVSILSRGTTTFSSAMSIHQIQQIRHAAKMLGIDLNNLDTDLEFNNIELTSKKLLPLVDEPLNDNDMLCNSEELLVSELEWSNSDEEESHVENMEEATRRDLEEETVVDIDVENPPYQLLVPTLFFKMEKSLKTNGYTNKRNRQYFQRVKSVKRGAMFVAHGVVRRGFEILHTI